MKIGDGGGAGREVNWHKASYAGFWRRFDAFFIDVICFAVLSFLIGLLFGITDLFWTGGMFVNSIPEDDPIYTILSIALFVGYWAIFESSHYHATPGKMALGLRVTDTDGYSISIWRSLGRAIFRTFLSGLFMGFGFLMIGFTEKKQGLHDKLANTIVVYERRGR